MERECRDEAKIGCVVSAAAVTCGCGARRRRRGKPAAVAPANGALIIPGEEEEEGMADNPIRKTMDAGRAHLRRLVSGNGAVPEAPSHAAPPPPPPAALSPPPRPAPPTRLPPVANPPPPSSPRLPPASQRSPAPSPSAARRRRDEYAANSASQPSIIEKTTRTLKSAGTKTASTVETSTTIAVGNDMYTIGEQRLARVSGGGGGRA